MTNSETIENASAVPQSWTRWQWLWSAVFYVTLAAAAIDSVNDLEGADRSWVIALTAGLAAWYSLGFWIGFDCWNQKHPALAAGYVAGSWALWIVAAAQHESFDIVAIGLYTQLFLVLPIKVAIGAAIALTGILLFRDLVVDGDEPGIWLLGVIAPLVIMVAIAYFIRAIATQSERRADLIRQLEETRSELAEREREAGTLTERQRLAGEIHDTLAQGFTTIVMHLEAAEHSLADDLEQSKSNLSIARQIARDNLAEARRMVWALKPEILEGASLAEAVKRHADEWSDRSRITVSFGTTGEERPLEPSVELSLLRAVQEGLANVRKHSGATGVDITLSYLDQLVALDIHDNGRGLPDNTDTRSRSGFGLQNLKARVLKLGGEVTLEPVTGRGALLSIQIPVAHSER